MSVSSFSTKRIAIDWYKLLYDTKDQKLINQFWYKFNHCKVKSKNRVARFVLIHYYSTTVAPDFVRKALSFNYDRKLVSVNLYE